METFSLELLVRSASTVSNVHVPLVSTILYDELVVIESFVMTSEVPLLTVIVVVPVTISTDASGAKLYAELLRSVEVPLIVS